MKHFLMLRGWAKAHDDSFLLTGSARVPGSSRWAFSDNAGEVVDLAALSAFFGGGVMPTRQEEKEKSRIAGRLA